MITAETIKNQHKFKWLDSKTRLAANNYKTFARKSFPV